MMVLICSTGVVGRRLWRGTARAEMQVSGVLLENDGQD